MKVVRSSPLRTSRLYPQEYPGTHFWRLSRPQCTRKCQLPQNKFQASRLGIDPWSFRLVALPQTIVENVNVEVSVTYCSINFIIIFVKICQRFQHLTMGMSETYFLPFRTGSLVASCTESLHPLSRQKFEPRTT